ncbi:MAG: hypothetical protein RJA61_468 [Candidatus Parcubacteria bacterium]
MKNRVLPFELKDGQWTCLMKGGLGEADTLYYLKRDSETPSENGKLVLVSISSDEVIKSTHQTVVPCMFVKEKELSLSAIPFTFLGDKGKAPYWWDVSGEDYRIVVSPPSELHPTSKDEICVCDFVSVFEEDSKSVIVVEIRERKKKMKVEEMVMASA